MRERNFWSHFWYRPHHRPNPGRNHHNRPNRGPFRPNGKIFEKNSRSAPSPQYQLTDFIGRFGIFDIVLITLILYGRDRGRA